MENAAKALLIAAGVLLSLMIITLLLIVVNSVAEFRKSRR